MNKFHWKVINIITDNTVKTQETYLKEEQHGTKYILLRCFPGESYYCRGTNSLVQIDLKKQYNHTPIMVTEEDFIQAMALIALGGYEYLHEFFKESLKDG